MVMAIVGLLLGQNHRPRCGQDVEARSPRLRTISFRDRFFAQYASQPQIASDAISWFKRGSMTCQSLIISG
jgi:hypothetical protein